MFTSEMIHLMAIVPDHHIDTVSQALLKEGVLDFVELSDLSENSDPRISAVTSNISMARMGECRQRIETLASSMESSPLAEAALQLNEMKQFDIDAIEHSLDTINAETQQIRNRQRDIQQEILKLTDMDRQLAMFGDLREGLNRKSSYSFLQIRAGSVPDAMLADFSSDMKLYPSVQLNFSEQNGRTVVMLVSLKKDEPNIATILGRYAWQEADLPEESANHKQLALSDVKNKIEKLKEQQSKVAEEYTALLSAKSSWLQETWSQLTVKILLAKIRSFFSRTQRTVLFSGWLPAECKASLEKRLKEAAEQTCILQWSAVQEIKSETEKKVSVPVRLKNPRFFEPFQMLVTNYDTPEYGSIDPTPFVAVAFLAMFGLMFADAGHGAVILLARLFAKRLLKNVGDSMKKLFTLAVYCGGAAIVTGVLFGSYFGWPLVPALWFDYHGLVAGHGSGNTSIRSIYDILLITIYFGISVIGTGLLINWVNLIRKKNYLTLFFDKGGIIGGWMYGIGVYTGFYFASHAYKELPPGLFVPLALGIPALLLLLKEPMHVWIHRGTHSEKITISTALNWVMEWIVEMLEIFSGYLANTLSFMRVAGLGIAHVSLMLAFAQIAGMAATAAGNYSIGSYLILVLGNALVIALEGLSAGIQSLRLNYYEFFSKYFSGSGKAYAPISLKKP